MVVSNAAILSDNAHWILNATWYIWREFLVIKVKHFNIPMVISRWNQFKVCQPLQSSSPASRSTLCCLCRFRVGREGHWQLRRHRVPLMNNLSVYFWVTQQGLNQGVAVMFFHKRRLSGGASQRRTAVPAVCPVELSPCPQPEARQHVRECHHFHLTRGRKLSLMTSNFLTFQMP